MLAEGPPTSSPCSDPIRPVGIRELLGEGRFDGGGQFRGVRFDS